jgi:hypothetical protein
MHPAVYQSFTITHPIETSFESKKTSTSERYLQVTSAGSRNFPFQSTGLPEAFCPAKRTRWVQPDFKTERGNLRTRKAEGGSTNPDFGRPTLYQANGFGRSFHSLSPRGEVGIEGKNESEGT